jgi:DNA-directed RNA polymerase specialized sigma24 family protein
MMRRQVPERDADDLVQTVLCDALAARGKPVSREEVARWLAGIARHKVADYHRRGHREVPSSPDLDEPRAGAVPPYEARDLLERIRSDAARDPETARALDWVLREHAGEELCGIARAERVQPAAMRQRVSRFRRALRSRWLKLGAVGVVVLGLGWGGASLTRDRSEPDGAPAIAPEPSTTPREDAPKVLHGKALGAWKVARVERLDMPDQRLRALVVQLAPGAVADIGERRAEIRAAGIAQTYDLKTSPEGGDVAFLLSDDRGPVLRGTGKLQPDGTLRVRFKSGPIRGEAVLERVR